MLYSKILVTGCGGDIGFAVGKILKESNVSEQVIGCDINEDHPGELIFDSCEVVERADSDGYLESLRNLIGKYKIDLIIPTSEPEIRFFAQRQISNINKVPILKANQKSLDIGFDKYATSQFLQSSNLEYPWTILVNQSSPKDLPCIIKSRTGCGSKDVYIVDKNNVEYYSKMKGENIWQELLLPNDEEYTCGVYRAKTNEVRTIIFKRQLKDTITKKAETVCNLDIEELLINVANFLELKGSINIQLRLTSRGPVIFEINPRFSSTVAFRHKLGFKDVIWSILEERGQDIENYVPVKSGIKAYRVLDEAIIF